MKKLVFVLTTAFVFGWMPLAQAQILEELAPETGVADNEKALETLCRLHELLYRLPLQYKTQYASLEKHRKLVELDTIRMEQQKKLDPDVEEYPERTQTERFYSYQFTQEPTLCAQLDQELNVFISLHEAELQTAVDALVAATPAMNEEQRARVAKKLADCTQTNAATEDARQILYACIYRTKNIRNVPLAYSVEKTMRRLFKIQEPLFDAWLGNVD